MARVRVMDWVKYERKPFVRQGSGQGLWIGLGMRGSLRRIRVRVRVRVMDWVRYEKKPS